MGRGEKAKEEFERVFAKKDIPTDMEEFVLVAPVWICQALVDAKLVDSTSQARRDINSNAVSVNQEKISDLCEAPDFSHCLVFVSFSVSY